MPRAICRGQGNRVQELVKTTWQFSYKFVNTYRLRAGNYWNFSAFPRQASAYVEMESVHAESGERAVIRMNVGYCEAP